MAERFVKVVIYDDEDTPRKKCGIAWGLLDDSGLCLVWTRSKRVVDQIGDIGEQPTGLHPCEEETIVDADDTNTPKHIWAKLAHYRLDPEGFAKEYNK